MNNSRINPGKRSFTPRNGLSGAVPAVRGSESHHHADREVVAFIWGLSLFFLAFLLLMAGLMSFVWGLLLTPFVASIHIGLSSMGGSKIWAWSMAAVYVAFCVLWLVAVLSNA